MKQLNFFSLKVWRSRNDFILESEGEIKKVEGYNPLRQDFVMLYTLRKADHLKDVEKNDI